MGCDQYTVLVAVAVELTFVAFLSTRKHTSMAARAILFNFLEELRERPQYLSGLSRVLFFPTTFHEIAVNHTFVTTQAKLHLCLCLLWYGMV